MITNENKFKLIELFRRVLMLLSAVAVAALAYLNVNLPLLYACLAAAVIGVAFIVLVYYALAGFAFFSFEQVGDVLLFKCYATGNFTYKRMKISVSKTDFAGYKLQQSFYKRHTKLIVYEWMSGRKAAYPPLSISFLSAGQRNQLINILQKNTPLK